METKVFYRVCNTETNQGLWYDFEGNFTGLIHGIFNFCKSNILTMPFTEDIVGYLSVADSLENLWEWFTEDEIKRLQDYGYCIHEYESDDYKWNINHWVIRQSTASLKRKIIL